MARLGWAPTITGLAGRPRKGRPTPAEPVGDEVATALPVCAPREAGVGLVIPERGDACRVEWFAVQHASCDVDAADPTPLSGRERSV